MLIVLVQRILADGQFNLLRIVNQMHTHVIVTGHTRTLQVCWPNIRWYLLRHFENVQLWVSLVDDEQGRDLNLIVSKSRDWFGFDVGALEFIHQPSQQQLIESCSIEPIVFNASPHSAFAISSSEDAIVKQLWHMNRGWEIAHDSISENDTVLRLRPDLWFLHYAHSKQPTSNQVYTPYWGKWGGLNDRLAWGGRNAMRRYMTTYASIGTQQSMGCPLHPETLIAGSMDKFTNYDMDAVFSTRRVNGTIRDPEFARWEMKSS